MSRTHRFFTPDDVQGPAPTTATSIAPTPDHLLLGGCLRCEGAIAWREVIHSAFRGRELFCINCGAIAAYHERLPMGR